MRFWRKFSSRRIFVTELERNGILYGYEVRAFTRGGAQRKAHRRGLGKVVGKLIFECEGISLN